MKKARLAAQSRSQLDERFRELGPANRYTPPVRGWIKALREALGMSTAQLAKRLGIRQPSLVALEQSEAKGTIELATLRRVAEAGVEQIGVDTGIGVNENALGGESLGAVTGDGIAVVEMTVLAGVELDLEVVVEAC